MSVLITAAMLSAPVALLVLSILRASAIFSSVRNLFDGGEDAVRPVMERLAISRGSRSVTLLLDLADLGPTESSVRCVQRFLEQRYRNLELLVLCGGQQVPTELRLAFDLTEAGTAGTVTVHRSRRDDRVACVVSASDGEDARARWQHALDVASGDLVLPLDGRWKLSANAVAELAAPWARTPRIAATVGVVHPRSRGRLGTTRLVSTRADLIATAGLGGGSAVRAALGALASGNEGCIAGVFKRDLLIRLGGLSGPVADPATWTDVGHRLQVDAQVKHIANAVHVLTRPLGLVESTERRPIGTPSAGLHVSVKARMPRLILTASGGMGYLSVVSILAAVVGLVTKTISSDIVWIAASAPLVALTVVVIGLMMDDRALRPVGSTRARLSLLAGSLGAGLWGTIGSPLRRPSRELHRA